MPGTGALESTVHHAYLRGAKLRQQLARSDSPPALHECKRLLDKYFRIKSDVGTVTAEEESTPPNKTKIPQELRRLLKKTHALLAARLVLDGVTYCRSSTHIGNSLIYYYSNGDRTRRPIPGSIKYIVDGKFATQRQLAVPANVLDPFRHYPGFPAKLYSSSLSDELEIVQTDWVVGHYARWIMPSGNVVVLALSRVSLIRKFHFLES